MDIRQKGGDIMEKGVDRDGKVKVNLYGAIQMVVDNPQLILVDEDGIIKVSSMECPINPKLKPLGLEKVI